MLVERRATRHRRTAGSGEQYRRTVISVAITYLLVFGGALVLWWLFKKKPASLPPAGNDSPPVDIWEGSFMIDDGASRLDVVLGFREMQMHMVIHGGLVVKSAYALRRRENGWQMKRTAESQRRHAIFIQEVHEKNLTNPLVDEEELAASTAAMAAAAANKADEWQEVGEALEPSLETAYQRYIRSA